MATYPQNPQTLQTYSQANILQPFRNPQDARTIAAQFAPSINIAKGTVLGRITAQGEVVTVDLSGGDDPTGGTFKINVGGTAYVTGDLAWNATAEEVQLAVEQLETVGVGNVTVGKAGFVYTLTFSADLGNVGTVDTVDSALTSGGSITVTVTVTTAGVDGGGNLKAYNNGNSDGSETAVAIAMYSLCTDANGNVFFNSDNNTTPSFDNPAHSQAPVFIAGEFLSSDLTGWDSNAATDFKATVPEPGVIRIP